MSRNTRQYSGFTLLETLIVVAIIGMIALVVIPSLSTSDEKVLEQATNEVVQAIRHAHSEAIRSGIEHGVVIDQASQRVRLYWLDTSGGSPVPTYDIRHPLDKKLYDFNLQSDAYPARLSSVYIKYQLVALPQNFVGFVGVTGTPKYNDSGTTRMLETATIQLEYRGETRTISVAPLTGRVDIQ